MTLHPGSKPPLTELELLASAIAGRGVTLEPGRHGVYTDGAVIYVSADVTAGAEQCRHAVVAQAVLIAAGSLSSSRMRRLSRSRPGSARRYLGLEIARACQAMDEALPGAFQAAVHPYAARVGVTGSPDESLLRAVGRTPLEEPPAWFGDLRPVATLRSPGADGETPSDSELAKAIRAAMEPEQDDEDDGERSAMLEKLSSPLRSPLGSVFQRMMGARRSSGGEGLSGSGVSVVEQHTGRAPSTARQTTQALPPSVVRAGGQLTRGATYPEWDAGSSAYRPRWCTVGHFDPPTGDDPFMPPSGVDQRLIRELSRVGLTWRPHDAEALGDELDLTALVDYRVAVAAGTSAEPRIYRAERRTAQELGVLVLLDATGSTSEQHEGHAIFEEQRDLAHGITTALDQLGARVATYAFYSRGRGNVRYLRCKTFEERWGVTAQRRLFALRPTGFTRLGAAIRHGIHLLDTQAGSQHRLLIVVGDGVPYDDGYEGRYAVADTRRAIDEARSSAVGCVGLSTRRTPGSSEIWDREAHRVTATTAELAADARVLLGTALGRAGRGRAVHHVRSAS